MERTKLIGCCFNLQKTFSTGGALSNARYNRAWVAPLYWQFLDKKGASNLREKQSLLKPVIRLLKPYQLIILGDREFHSVKLANWLNQQNLGFVLRQKKGQKWTRLF